MMRGWAFALVLVVGCKQDPGDWVAPDVVLNEIVASNATGLQDESGAFPDWVELYNRGEEIADLSSFTLTDDVADPQKWSFPAGTEVEPDGFLIVFADGDPSTLAELHASFRLTAAGESLQLIGPASEDLPEIDTVEFGAQTTDVSWARMPDAGEWEADDTPTPGEPNG